MLHICIYIYSISLSIFLFGRIIDSFYMLISISDSSWISFPRHIQRGACRESAVFSFSIDRIQYMSWKTVMSVTGSQEAWLTVVNQTMQHTGRYQDMDQINDELFHPTIHIHYFLYFYQACHYSSRTLNQLIEQCCTYTLLPVVNL